MGHGSMQYLAEKKLGAIMLGVVEKFLGCVYASTGELLWRNSDTDLLEAIGPNEKAQHYVTGYATSTYLKSNHDYVLFAGPQRPRLVVASAEDGKLAWQKPSGNYQ